jgi:hypothetical protein
MSITKTRSTQQDRLERQRAQVALIFPELVDTEPVPTAELCPAPGAFVTAKFRLLDWAPGKAGYVAGYVAFDDQYEQDPEKYLRCDVGADRSGLAVIRYPTSDGGANTAFLAGDLLRTVAARDLA